MQHCVFFLCFHWLIKTKSSINNLSVCKIIIENSISASKINDNDIIRIYIYIYEVFDTTFKCLKQMKQKNREKTYNLLNEYNSCRYWIENIFQDTYTDIYKMKQNKTRKSEKKGEKKSITILQSLLTFDGIYLTDA